MIIELKEKVYGIVWILELINYGEKIVVLVEYRDGMIIDVVKNV